MDEIKSKELVIDKTYDIRSSRKGMFWGRYLVDHNNGFGDFQIVSGKAQFLSEPDRGEGEIITLRFELCKFFPIKEKEYVSIEQFGKDHWSVLVYIETRVVDFKGLLDRNHMRTDIERHPRLVGPSQIQTDSRKYSTRLKNGALDDHDDWDCVEDLTVAGLVEMSTIEIVAETKFKLTDFGWKIAGQLRRHLAEGHSYQTFEVKKEL